jgi:response regulator RpfG family c-di-GMP phosphodiesterase|tara:strand:+ start:588 stop:986 length:399 start_codon:yes stop_codon:yes gene_type:complete
MWLKKLLDFSSSPYYNSSINKENEMATAKNYTDEQVSYMVKEYQANPTRDTVDVIAEELGKNARSVIAKLSREGVYVTQPRVTKRGEPIIKKAELVSEVATILGVDEESIATLEKATKADLQNLINRLSQVC